jgi:multisubunit Na+/H+ antiporter MnhB subunit
MDASQVYIFISVIILALVAIALYFASRKRPKEGLSKLAALAFAFIIAGIIFGEDRLIGYGLLGVGVLLALVDIYYKLRQRG